MLKSPSPRPARSSFVRFLFRLLPLAITAGTIACGGPTSSPNARGGGGGGGGPVTNCTQPAPFTSSPQTQLGVGKTVPTNFFNLHIGGSSLPWPTVQFSGLRLWDTNTGWAEINSADGVFDFSLLDGFAQVAQANGIDLLYNLARTPTWASSNPTDSTCDYDIAGQGGAGQCDPPNDLNSDGSGSDQHWINWITAVAQHNSSSPYAHIKYYELWNEWNATQFWSPGANSTQPQLVRMEQDARCVVEGPPAGLLCNPNSTFPSGTALDTEAQIVSPSPVGNVQDLNDVQIGLQTYFGTTVNGYAGGQFADIIGFHGYVSTGMSGVCPIPENVITVVDDMNSAITSFGESGKPWFNTEDGWSKAGDEGFVDVDRETAFMARYYLLQLSMGVAREYWYRWDATQAYEGALWTPGTGTGAGPIQAVATWNEVSNWILGLNKASPATVSTACTVSGSVWTCGYTRTGNGYQALAVWDASQDCTVTSCPTTTFNIPAASGGGSYALSRDLTGAETSISGATVQIGAKPILLETATLP